MSKRTSYDPGIFAGVIAEANARMRAESGAAVDTPSAIGASVAIDTERQRPAQAASRPREQATEALITDPKLQKITGVGVERIGLDYLPAIRWDVDRFRGSGFPVLFSDFAFCRKRDMPAALNRRLTADDGYERDGEHLAFRQKRAASDFQKRPCATITAHRVTIKDGWPVALDGKPLPDCRSVTLHSDLAQNAIKNNTWPEYRLKVIGDLVRGHRRMIPRAELVRRAREVMAVAGEPVTAVWLRKQIKRGDGRYWRVYGDHVAFFSAERIRERENISGSFIVRSVSVSNLPHGRMNWRAFLGSLCVRADGKPESQASFHRRTGIAGRTLSRYAKKTKHIRAQKNVTELTGIYTAHEAEFAGAWESRDGHLFKRIASTYFCRANVQRQRVVRPPSPPTQMAAPTGDGSIGRQVFFKNVQSWRRSRRPKTGTRHDIDPRYLNVAYISLGRGHWAAVQEAVA